MLEIRTRTRALVAVAAMGAAALTVGATLAATAGSSSAASGTPKISRQDLAKSLLQHRSAYATQGLLKALQIQSGEGVKSPVAESGQASAAVAHKVASAGGVAPAVRLGVPNVRVNNPALDSLIDQTTQSETSVAVSGAHVAVGYNSSRRALLAYTAGLNLSGYAYSADGGKTFTDGGTLPNAPGFQNLGDPWMATDSSGGMYYSTLTIDGTTGNLEIAVARSADGGRSWTTPTVASVHGANDFYSGDKDALTVGRSRTDAHKDVLYDAWDDFDFNPDTNVFATGLPVSRSTDGGRTWHLAYADKIVSDPNTCSFGQYLGSQPFVDPGDGTLYVFSEKISVDDPTCSGNGTINFAMMEFASKDGGVTFGPGVKVNDIGATNALILGPGQVVRTAEFPTVAKLGGSLYVAWNDGTSGRDHILMAKSANGGASWSTSAVTNGNGDEVQPALVSDASGLHVAYYQRNLTNSLDVVLADSTNGSSWVRHAVTDRSFPGALTLPQFDPIIAWGYMGDYIANVATGGHVYLAWGDNRDRVVNVMYPGGRNDPNVYFVRR